jgi:hypothetical protein
VKQYPRLEIYRAQRGDAVPQWYVALYSDHGRRVTSWLCFDYDHARLVASEVWAKRTNWLQP